MMKLPEIEIKVTLSKGEKIKIGNSQDAYNVFKDLFDPNTLVWSEEMILLAVNRNNEIYAWRRISSGGTTGTVCDPKVIFSILLNCGASAFILAHNHPSGTLIPSAQDISITKKLVNGGEILDINLLDHLIIGHDNYYSMADNQEL
jgi:DNA repair protein RadC